MSYMVGELVGHRYWVVSWQGNLFGPHSWRHWHPEEPMSGGNMNHSGHAGVYALKTRDLVERFIANVSVRRELANTWRSRLFFHQPTSQGQLLSLSAQSRCGAQSGSMSQASALSSGACGLSMSGSWAKSSNSAKQKVCYSNDYETSTVVPLGKT